MSPLSNIWNQPEDMGAPKNKDYSNACWSLHEGPGQKWNLPNDNFLNSGTPGQNLRVAWRVEVPHKAP